MQNSGIRVSNLSFIVDGIPLEREMRFAGSRRGTTLKLGQSYLGAHSRYQALFVLAIR